MMRAQGGRQDGVLIMGRFSSILIHFSRALALALTAIAVSSPAWGQCRVVQQDTSTNSALPNATHWRTTQWGPLPMQISYFVSNCPSLQTLSTPRLINEVLLTAQINRPSGGLPETRYGFLFDRSDPNNLIFALRFIPEEIGNYQVNTTISFQGQPLLQANALVESIASPSTEARGQLAYSATSPSRLRDRRSGNVVFLQGINDGHDAFTTNMAPFGQSGASDYKLLNQASAERDVSPNVSPETPNIDLSVRALADATNSVRLMLPNGFLGTYQSSSGESITMNDDSLRAAVVFDRRILAHAALNKFIWLTAMRDTTTYANSLDSISGMRGYLRYIIARWGCLLSILQFLNEPRGTNRSLAVDFTQYARTMFSGLLSIGWTDAGTPVDAAGAGGVIDAHLYANDQSINNQGAGGDIAISNVRAALQIGFSTYFPQAVSILGEVGYFANVPEDHQYARTQTGNDRRMLAANFEDGIGGSIYWPSAKTNCGTGPVGPYVTTEIFAKELFTLNLIDRVMKKISRPDLRATTISSNDSTLRARGLLSSQSLGVLVLGSDRTSTHSNSQISTSIPSAFDYKVYDINTAQTLASGRTSGSIQLPSFRDGVIVVGWLPGQEVNTKPILSLRTSASSNPYHRPHAECGPPAHDTLNGDRNTIFTITGNAVDLEGDSVAYSWTFDDGSPAIQNRQQISHQFPAGVWHMTLSGGGTTLIAQAGILGDVSPAVVNLDRIHNKWTPQEIALCPGQGLPYTLGVNYTEQRSSNWTYDYLLQDGFMQNFLSAAIPGVTQYQTNYGPSTVVVMPPLALANTTATVVTQSTQRSGSLSAAPTAVNIRVGDCNDAPLIGGGASVSNTYDFYAYEPNGEAVRMFLMLFNGDCAAPNLVQRYLSTLSLSPGTAIAPNTRLYHFNIPSGIGNYQICALPFAADPHDRLGFGAATEMSGYSSLSMKQPKNKKLSEKQRKVREKKNKAKWLREIKAAAPPPVTVSISQALGSQK